MGKKIWYKEAAQVWEQALPLGNGRLGAMVYGGVDTERIQLNEDTLWSGYYRDTTNGDAARYIEDVRKLVFSGEYRKAQDLIEEKMLGSWSESYLPFGNMYIKSLNSGGLYNYKRELDLEQGVSRTYYSFGMHSGLTPEDAAERSSTVDYIREVFISKPDDVIAVRISCSVKSAVSISVVLDSELRYNSQSMTDGTIVMQGKAPTHVEPSYVHPTDKGFRGPIIYDDNEKSLKFTGMARVIPTGGTMQENSGKIEVYNADEVIILAALGTDFDGKTDVEGRLLSQLDNASKKTWDELRKRHIDDFSELFDRVRLEIGKDKDEIPTDERLKLYKNGAEDTALEALLFDFGRYLIISSSREGTQPINLQGIWNQNIRPAWSSNLTLNINTQMNYWSVEKCGLSECHEPLLTAIEQIAVSGAKTAKENFDARGFTVNHNSDIWRLTTPVGGNAQWAFWPVAGGWLCRHMYEHYVYTSDIKYLREKAYPIMKQGCLFMIDWLVDDGKGNLVTCPSTSPENNFITDKGEICAVSMMSTMDNCIIRELFANTIKSAEILNIDAEFADQLKTAIDRLLPFKEGSDGQLLEWFEDFKESDKGHRHLSHLYGLYPADVISSENNSEWLEPCRKSIDIRVSNGGGGTGWSSAWLTCLYARLKDGEAAHKQIRYFITEFVGENLMDLEPPFQIDGNMGYTAAICEMLVQCHTGEIELLAALPKAWKNGIAKGFKAAGGKTVDIAWEDGKIIV